MKRVTVLADQGRRLLVLALSLALLAVTPQVAFATDFGMQRDAGATVDCDHLYYSNYRSGSVFDNDGSGHPVITNRVISRRAVATSPPNYWSSSMAAGRDPDTGKPALFYANYTTSNLTLYKQVQGANAATDNIYGSTTINLPAGVNWGGLGADPNSDTLFGAENLSTNKTFFTMNLRTGASTVFRPTGPAGDTIWSSGATIPDIFVDSDGFPYMGVYYGSASYVYRIDPVNHTAVRALQITGPGALGSSLYGMAFHKDAVYVGSYDGSLYRVDAATGASTLVSGGKVEANTTGSPIAETGGSWPITDLASCAVSPPLVPTLKVKKTLAVNGAVPTRVMPGDRVTYTVTLTNTSAVPYPAATLSDSLANVLNNATYNNDATARNAAGTAVGAFTATPPPSLAWQGDVPAGATYTLTYSVTVRANATDGAALRNTVVSNTGTNCATGSTDPDCSTSVPIVVVKVAVTKTSAPAAPLPGDKVTYTITAVNSGSTAYAGATIGDDLSGVLGGADYNNDATGKDGSGAVLTAPTYTAPRLSWTGPVPAGGRVVISYTVTVKNPVPAGKTTLTNAVTTNIPGQCPAGSTDPNCTTVTKLPRLDVTKTAAPNPAKVGDTITYTVTARNTGDADYPGATIGDDLTDVLTGADYNGDAAAKSGTGTALAAPTYTAPRLSWTGTVAKGASVVITYTVKATGATSRTLVNKVTASGSNCPPGSTDPACTSTVPLASVTVVKTSSPAAPKPGGTLTYTVTVSNTGQADYTGATVNDDLSGVLGGADYNNDATARTGTGTTLTPPTYTAPRLSWTGTVAKGGTVVITYTVKVKNPVPAGRTTLTNAVTTNIPGQCPPGSTDPNCTTVTRLPRLEVSKTATPTEAKTGDTVTYRVTARNTGEADYPGAVVTDDLTKVLTGAGYNGDAAATGGGTVTYASPKITWTGTIATGATVVITYTVKVTGSTDGKLVNVVTADGSNCPAGSTDPACTSTVLLKHLTVRKSVDRTDAKPGDKVTYTVTVTNDGQTAYTGASFTDNLGQVLDDATYGNDAAATAGTVSYSAPTVSWTGDLAKGAVATVTYSVTVNSPLTGDGKLGNAVVSPDGGCPAGSTDPKCSNEVRIRHLTVVKTSSAAEVKAGGRISYTVTVTNDGQLDYTAATFTDNLSKVIDDATYNGDATATTGTVGYTAPTLTWTGALKAGQSASVTYSVTVNNPLTGDGVLTNAVVSPDGGCPAGSTDPKCTNEVRIKHLKVRKTADRTEVRAGDKVTYTLVVTNDGKVNYPGATFTDDLTKIVDDAVYGNDAAAGSGRVVYSAPRLTWTGDLAAGASATVTYSVVINNPYTADARLDNVVVAPDSNCPTGSTDPACSVHIPARNVKVVKTSTPSQAKPGDKVTYTVTVTNLGDAVTGTTFSDDLTQVLDDAVYGNDATASTGTATYAAPVLTWRGDLAKGAVATVTYSVTVNNPATGDRKLTNAVVSPDGSCPPGSTDPACHTTVLIRSMKVVKTSTPAQAKPGDKVTYTVTVTNDGQLDLTGASFTDDLTKVIDDATYGNDAAASIGTAGYTAPNLSWTGDLKVGEKSTVTYSVTVNKPLTGDGKLGNAVVSPDGGCPPGSTDPACSNEVRVKHYKVVKTSTPAQAKPGDKVGYTVTVTNDGQVDLTGATFTDDLTKVLDDAVYNKDAAATAGGVTYAAPTISWTGDLKAGAIATVTYSVTVNNPPTGDKKLTNAVVSADGDCPPGSTDPKCSNEVRIRHLTVVKTSTPTQAKPGDKVTYTVTVTNDGQLDYAAATFTDDLTKVIDDATYNGDAAATIGTAGYTAPTLSWTGALKVGESATITYSVTVNNPPTGDKKLTNAVVSADSNCPPGSTDPKCSNEVRIRHLTVVKTSTPAQAKPGDKVSYTVTVTNDGQLDYAAATFTDDLTKVTDDATYGNDATASTGTAGYTAPTLSWTGALKVGEQATVTYSVTVKSPLSGDGRLTNAVVAPDGNCPAGSTDPACTNTVLVKHLKVVKKADKASVRPGDRITYTVTVTNDGQVPYPAASFTDDLTKVTDDATYGNDATATIGTATYTAPTLSWTGNLPVGASSTITYSVTVNDPDTGDKKLTNAVVAPESNCPPGSTDPECSTVVPARNIRIVKTSTPAQAKPGDRVAYTVTVTNLGDQTAVGVAFTDDLTKVIDDATYNKDATATVGKAAYTAPTISWLGDLAKGQAATITYSVTVNNPISGDGKLTNAVVSPDGACPTGSTDPECSNEVKVRHLTVAKTSSTTEVTAGGKVTYTVTVINDGQLDIPGSSFTDDLTKVIDDASYGNDATATIGTATYTAPKLTWTGDLKVGERATVTYSVTVNNPLTGDRRLTNTVVSTDSNCPPGSTDPSCGTVTPVRHLKVVKKADKASATPGGRITYTVTVTNDGRTYYPGATFSDTLAKVIDDATYNGDATATTGTATYAAPVLSWTGDLLAGDTATITYSVTVNSPPTGDGRLTNAVVSPDSNCPADSTDPDCTSTVPVRHLKVTKTVDRAEVKAGDKVTYTVTVLNDGASPFTGASFTDDFSGLLTHADFNRDATASAGTVTAADRSLSWTGDLAVGQQETVRYSFTVKSPVPAGAAEVSNLVFATDSSCPPGSTDPACTKVTPVRRLELVKQADKSSVQPGDRITYTVVITNTGGAPFDDATATDDLSRLLDDAAYGGDATASTGTLTYAAPKLTWKGGLAVGASATVTYSVTVNRPATGDGDLDNTVTAPDSNCPIPMPRSVRAGGAVDPRCSSHLTWRHLTVRKQADRDRVQPGERVTYTVTVTNDGAAPYPGASFSDDLTGVLANARWNGDARAGTGTVEFRSPVLRWQGDLALGATATVTYSVTRTGDGRLVNAVTAPDSNCPPGATDPACTSTVDPGPKPPVPPVPPTPLPGTGSELPAGMLLTVSGSALLLGGLLRLTTRRRRNP
ncbi:hypothetical protein [Kitasatospora sp. NPDC002040]|uniref:DUF7927 domain-containing protein n=1 Tax=Kitasatospora sp. NPDC002040 TaxID=3154661 RepID=UPI003318B7F8